MAKRGTAMPESSATAYSAGSSGVKKPTPGTVLFFWDYDTQWGADRSRIPGRSRTWGHLEFENTERLLALHAEYDVPACFAVVGAAALPGERPYHDPQQIRRIHEAGHEIASHSFSHDWLPGVGSKQLRATLAWSKDALEQCIGAPVRTFVPPYNQPFDYAARWSFSLSERTAAGSDRVDLGRLCDALCAAGYQVCRVSYRPMYVRLAEVLVGRRLDRPVRPESIGGMTCIRLNTPGGFDQDSQAVVERCVGRGGSAVVHGHPHSLHSGNSQDERWLTPFLQHVRNLRAQGLLRIGLPGQLEEGG
jgi:hypothetical protein